jgi:hypothetical protein
VIARITPPAAIALIGVWIAASAFGQTEPVRPEPADARNAPVELNRNPAFDSPQFERGTDVPVLRMTYAEREPDAVIEAISGALAVMLDGEVPTGTAESLERSLYGDEADGWTRLPMAPQLLVKVDPRFDEFRIINDELDALREPQERISLDAARVRAERALAELERRNVVSAALYRDAAIQIGYRRVGSGSTATGSERGAVIEYRVTYRPRIEGIELANAGVRLGLLLDGRLSSLRIGGVTPIGEFDDRVFEPGDDGERRSIETTTGQQMRRFYRSIDPNSEPMIAWSRVMYAMPDDMRSALVEPRLVVSFSERYGTDNGATSISRRRILGFSLVDPEVAPFDFTAPTATPSPDEPRRQE